MLEKNNDLVIRFSNPKALKHFVSWLCEHGEQNYWEWMEYRESEEKGDITAFFDYHSEDGKIYLPSNIIRANCSRLDKRE
jgi:hypothetical protein